MLNKVADTIAYTYPFPAKVVDKNSTFTLLERGCYFLWLTYSKIATISIAVVSMTMNSSYVLIENASFLQGSERRYSHPIGCLVKHIILSWCSSSPIWNRSKQVAFKMRAQDCAGWYFPHLKCRKCLVVFTLHGGYSHLFRCIFIRRGRWFAYAFGFRLPYNRVPFAAERKTPLAWWGPNGP